MKTKKVIQFILNLDTRQGEISSAGPSSFSRRQIPASTQRSEELWVTEQVTIFLRKINTGPCQESNDG